MSENQLVHRDIKPDNIFINKNVYKIGDFGFAREVVDKFATQLGTPLYMGPEFYNNDALTPKVDIWATGCMFHQMLFGNVAFDGANQMEVQNNVKNSNYRPPRKLDPIVEEVICGMLAAKPEKRFGIAELRMHKVFDFCRNQYASKLDRTLGQSYFNPQAGLKSTMPQSNIRKIDAAEQRRMDLDNQKSSIIESLMKYRNVSMFYYTNARWLNANYPDLDFTIFLLAKRGVQKLSILLHFLKTETQVPNHKELTLDCTAEGWKHFVSSSESEFIGLLVTIIADVAEARGFFQTVYEKTQNVFAGASQQMRAVINDDMNSVLAGMLVDCLKNAVKFLLSEVAKSGQQTGPHINVCMYFCILDNFEGKQNDEKRYNLADFIKQVKTFTYSDKMELLNGYLNK